MIDPIQLEEAYGEFSRDLLKWVPDGVVCVNMDLLHNVGLLRHDVLEQSAIDDLSHFFHVLETPDKVTLFNQQFAIWIVPQTIEEASSTLTYISLLNANKPHLEIVFSTSGVYNSPKYILKVLQHFLQEVIDTEAVLSSIGKKEPE